MIDRTRTLVSAAILAISSLAPGLAGAAPVTLSPTANFSAVNQNMFGPGNSLADWGFGGGSNNPNFLVGGSALGIRAGADASSGRVDANVNGLVNINYDNAATPYAPVTIGLGFAPTSGNYDTRLGAGIAVLGSVLTVGFDIFVQDFFLDIEPSFAPTLGTARTGSDSFTALGVAVGPNIVVASAEAGVDIDIEQNASFTPEAIEGKLVATHHSGDTKEVSFTIGAAGIVVDLGLLDRGLWTMALLDLTLDNTFFTDFDMLLVPFVQYTVGLGCGDPGDDGDNGILCGGDGRIATSLVDFDLFTSPAFPLGFNTISSLTTFQLQVPEPGGVALLGLGLAMLVLVRRAGRRERRTASGR